MVNWSFWSSWLGWQRRRTTIAQNYSRHFHDSRDDVSPVSWFLFYYVSAMFIKRDPVTINKNHIYDNVIPLCVSKSLPAQVMECRLDCWRRPDPFSWWQDDSGSNLNNSPCLSINKPPHSSERLNQLSRSRINKSVSQCIEIYFRASPLTEWWDIFLSAQNPSHFISDFHFAQNVHI